VEGLGLRLHVFVDPTEQSSQLGAGHVAGLIFIVVYESAIIFNILKACQANVMKAVFWKHSKTSLP